MKTPIEQKLKAKEANKKFYENLRMKVLIGYGLKCACCGEYREQFLALDHVNGGGKQEWKNKGHSFHYKDAVKRNFPPEYRLLCHNCNFSLGHYGFCPHNKDFR